MTDHYGEPTDGLDYTAAGHKPADPTGWLDVYEVADLLGVKPDSVRQYRKLGRIPDPVKFGAMNYWREAEIHAWLPTRNKPGGQPADKRTRANTDRGGVGPSPS